MRIRLLTRALWILLMLSLATNVFSDILIPFPGTGGPPVDTSLPFPVEVGGTRNDGTTLVPGKCVTVITEVVNGITRKKFSSTTGDCPDTSVVTATPTPTGTSTPTPTTTSTSTVTATPTNTPTSTATKTSTPTPTVTLTATPTTTSTATATISSTPTATLSTTSTPTATETPSCAGNHIGLACLAGRVGGQTLVGGTSPGNSLSLTGSTSSSGAIRLGKNANSILKEGTASGASKRDKLGINYTNPQVDLDVVADTFWNAEIFATQYTNDINGPTMTMRKARGSLAIQSGVLLNDSLGAFGFRGGSGSSFEPTNACQVTAKVTENWAGVNNGANFSFSCNPNGTNLPIEAFRVSGNRTDNVSGIRWSSKTNQGNCVTDGLGDLSCLPTGAVSGQPYRDQFTFSLRTVSAIGNLGTSIPSVWINEANSITIEQVCCEADTVTGTPAINFQRDDGSPANILSANLACPVDVSLLTDCSTGLVAGEDILAIGDKLDLSLITATWNTAVRLNVSVKYKTN